MAKMAKKIYMDCAKAMAIPMLLLIIKELLESLLNVYTASILGEFADSVFTLDLSLGKQQILKLVISVFIMVVIIPLTNFIGNFFMLKYSLAHDRTVFNTFFKKEYLKIACFDVGEAIYRIENDPNELRIY
ncbi:MAG: hypothetical protein LUE12_07090 [Ruminococcus sp.]|nr:hypothetical protein [Ruminococcus sp.]